MAFIFYLLGIIIQADEYFSEGVETTDQYREMHLIVLNMSNNTLLHQAFAPGFQHQKSLGHFL